MYRYDRITFTINEQNQYEMLDFIEPHIMEDHALYALSLSFFLSHQLSLSFISQNS